MKPSGHVDPTGHPVPTSTARRLALATSLVAAALVPGANVVGGATDGEIAEATVETIDPASGEVVDVVSVRGAAP